MASGYSTAVRVVWSNIVAFFSSKRVVSFGTYSTDSDMASFFSDLTGTVALLVTPSDSQVLSLVLFTVCLVASSLVSCPSVSSFL